MYRLLIVDDERATLNGLCNYIPWDQMGFIVEGSAANGKAALAYLENHTVDVLLSDIRMPVMDGIELVARVRELGYDMECVFLSAHRDFEYAKKGLQYGVLDYILKPTKFGDIREVFGHVREKLDEKRNREEIREENMGKDVIEVKMKESQRLLKDSRYRIREVSEMVGYTNEKNFARAFHLFCQMSPREYRDSQTGSQANGGKNHEAEIL